MEKKFNDSSSALSRFARDKRVRTVTAATERTERRPRTERTEGGHSERAERSFNRNDRGSKPVKRASYNPHFSEDNRPLFEQGGEERRSFGGRKPQEGRRFEDRKPFGERKSFGDRKPFGERSFGDKPAGEKKFGDKRFDGKKFDGKKGEGKSFGDKKFGAKKPGLKRSYTASDERPQHYPKFNPERQTGEIRLNRFLAQSGICSRREADDFITAGLVTVNGVIVTELGTKVLSTDEVRFNDERLQGEKKVYLVLNKPKGYVTSIEDPHADKLVMDLVKNACTERIYPVGRLDKNSLGLLLFTNDGDLTKTLTHPSYRKKKIYQVTIDKPLTRADMDRLAEGITLEDGEIYADEISYLKENKQEIGIEIHSGRNRIVRRMFEFLGYTVTKLDRVYYAGLTKKNLKRGAWRFLTKEEVTRLKAGLYE